jgi:hypothetical protein
MNERLGGGMDGLKTWFKRKLSSFGKKVKIGRKTSSVCLLLPSSPRMY